MTKTDPAIETAIREDLRAGLSLRKAAAKHGVGVGVAERISKNLKEETPATQEHEFTQSGDKATCEFQTTETVQTEADALRLAGVDTTRWRVTKMRIKTYQTAMKMRKGKDAPDEEKVVQLYAIHLDLALILPEPYLGATEALFRRLEAQAPYFSPSKPSVDSHTHIAEIDLFDVHFGKLCWAPESGNNYDLRIAESIFLQSVEDLLEPLEGYKVGRFILPLGNDLFHIDTLARTTTAGTVVDADCRYAKMIEIGEAAVLSAIERLLCIAPVDVIHVPGNHDRLASYHLCRTVSAWFRNSDRVSVDLSPKPRKYKRYGTNLFGYTHGDKGDAKLAGLPALMAVECPQDWALTTCREWKLGHLHTSKRFETRSSQEYNGIQVRYLSSLSGTDAYHFENGWVGNRRAAEAYLYSLESGYLGHFVAMAR